MTAQEEVQKLIADIRSGGTLPEHKAIVRVFIDHVIEASNAKHWMRRALAAEKLVIEMKTLESWRTNPDQMGR